MKRLLPLLAVLALVLLTPGCANKQGTVQPGAPAPAPAPSAQTAAAAKPAKPFKPFAWLGAWRKLIPRKTRPPTAIPPTRVGEVKVVSLENQFVLIDAATLQGASPNDVLVCIANQQETAQLRLSTLKSPPFLIADIISGTPSVGDKVYKP